MATKNIISDIISDYNLIEWLESENCSKQIALNNVQIRLYKTTDSKGQFYYALEYERSIEYNDIIRILSSLVRELSRELEKIDIKKLCYNPAQNTHMEY